MQLFLLLFLLIREATASSVPGCRGDRDKDHRPRENCTAAGFRDIPAGLEHNTQVLLFPYNLFSSLSWTSFQVFTEIYEIDLTANKVPGVTPGSAPILPGLSVLRLGSNHLTFLSDGSFTACPALTELYLENNYIASLTDRTFSGLSKLEILDLTSNHISILPGLMLHPLAAIETLYLETNKIKVMPDGWFRKKEEVPYLYLSDNPWACSCSLGYLRRYLEDYEINVYVRDGPLIRSDVESVVCDSPQQHQGKPVMTLEESDLCSPSAEEEPEPPGDFYEPMISVYEYEMISVTSVPSVAPSTPETTLALHRSSVALTALSTPEPTTTEQLLPTADHRVVTWSWYQTFTSLLEWSYHSRTEIKTERSFVGLFAHTTHPVPMTARPSTTPFRTTTNVALTRTSTTPQIIPAAATTETASTAVTSLVSKQSVGIRKFFKVSSAGGGAVFCVWLFAGSLLLCMSSAALVLVTVVRLIIWYKKVYKPLSLTLARRVKGREGVALLLKSKKEENAVSGDGGVVALYRSLLFVNREGGDIVEEERNKGQIITLKLTGGDEPGDRRGPEDKGVYRKTMYRLLSREEEIEGWRDVVEECRVSAEDGGRKRAIRRDEELTGGAGGVTKKRYSVILREEREEAGGGLEELDWVVGGWEVKRGAEGQPRSSWGQWLAENVPSMPWGLTAPSEEEAAAQ